MKRTTIGLHHDRQVATARHAFRESRTGLFDEAEREAAIALLPRVEWKGRTLFTLRCQGTSGRGPHDTNVAEWLLWALIDFRAYRCPFHANSELAREAVS